MDYRISEILLRIEKRHSQTVDIVELAKSANISTSRLQHLFKQETGSSILQHLKMVRVKKAAELLETSNLRVKEIRVKIGAGSDSNFIREFRAVYGSCPSEYRTQVRGQV